MVQPQARSPGAGALGASRTARPSRPHLGQENMPASASIAAGKKSASARGTTGNASFSGISSATGPPHRLRSAASARGNGTALHDITNVAGARAVGKPMKTLSLADNLNVVAKAPLCAVDIGPPSDTADRKLEHQGVSEYVSEIFDVLFRDEALGLPLPNYLHSQADINGKMRAILVDWLVEVHMKYKLRYETLFLTVNLIDRFLARTPVTRKRLQLVGVVALLIAAKFEEIDPPRICDLVYITDNAYTKDDIIVMECTMLTSLGLHIVVPTVAHFIDHFEKGNQCDGQQRAVIRYLLELALLDAQMIRHAPSHLAAAAVLLSNELRGQVPAWSPSMAILTRHTEPSLRDCANELRAFLDAATRSPLQVVRRKYMHEQHHCVAKIMTGSAVLRGSH